MEKVNLTAQDYALALFLLCSDVMCWNVRPNGGKYYYFNSKSLDDLDIVWYILRANNVRAKHHLSRQYGGYDKKTRKVLRVTAHDFNAKANKEFVAKVQEMRKSEEKPTPISAGSHKLFLVWSKNKKAKLIRELAERAK